MNRLETRPSRRNRRLSPFAAGLAAWIATQALPAQGGVQPSVQAAEPATPIHTRAADPAAYGTWAAGANYKVSFHDGMVFYPHVGPDLPHHPLRWTTRSVRIGNQELLVPGATPRTRQDDLRFEYDHGAVVERYDVLAQGVEQSFVLERATGTGDLVIRGEVQSPLALPEMAPQHGPIRLGGGDGTVEVVYGAATAIDARGRSTPMLSASSGTAIELRLSGAWLAEATFPVVVDPLIANTLLNLGGPVTGSDVLHETSSPAAPDNRAWVVYSRAVAAGDQDLWLRRFASDFTGAGTIVFADLSTDETNHGRVALVGDTDQVVTVFQVRNAASSAFVSWHVHDANSLVLDTAVGTITPPAGSHDWRPVVGGSTHWANKSALIAFQRDASGATFANTANSAVYGAILDPTAPFQGNITVGPFALRSGGNRDQEHPAVNRKAGELYQREWLVAFQEHNGAVVNDDWDIAVVEIDTFGLTSAAAITTDDEPMNNVHKLGPVIDGEEGRYLLVYSTTDFDPLDPKPSGIDGRRIKDQRIDWDHLNHTGGIARASKTVANSTVRSLAASGIGYDEYTESHWCAAWTDSVAARCYAAKLGYRGLTVEADQVLALPAFTPEGGGVCFNGSEEEFLIVFGANAVAAGANRLGGTRMLYDAVAAPMTYGAACGAGTFDPVSTPQMKAPRIGEEFIHVDLANTPTPNGVALLALSLAPGSVNLAGWGLNGCDLLVDPSAGIFLGTHAVPLSFAHGKFEFSLPEFLAPGAVFMQWIYPAPGLNPAGLQTSDALQVDFGR